MFPENNKFGGFSTLPNTSAMIDFIFLTFQAVI